MITFQGRRLEKYPNSEKMTLGPTRIYRAESWKAPSSSWEVVEGVEAEWFGLRYKEDHDTFYSDASLEYYNVRRKQLGYE